MNQDGGLLPLPLGEGWGEGLRSFLMSSAPSPARLRCASPGDLSPPGRGELLGSHIGSTQNYPTLFAGFDFP